MADQKEIDALKAKNEQILAAIEALNKGEPAPAITTTIVQEAPAPTIDMDKLYEAFASKNPPDNTIVRIEELEKLTKSLGDRLDAVPNAAPDNSGEIADLTKRLAAVEEKVNGSHEPRITKLESEVAAMRDSLATPASGDTIDASQIMMRINMLQTETNQKFDDLKMEIERCHTKHSTHVE